MGGEKAWRKNGKKAKARKEQRMKNGKKKSGKPTINASFLFLLF